MEYIAERSDTTKPQYIQETANTFTIAKNKAQVFYSIDEAEERILEVIKLSNNTRLRKSKFNIITLTPKQL